MEEELPEKENYPTTEDTAFTLDEIESIREYKCTLSRKLDKNRSVLSGLEMSFWGITSYSLCRFLIISSGTQGLSLALAAAIFINQINNRGLIDKININRRDGQWESNGMENIFKFIFTSAVTGVVVVSGIGHFWSMVDNSKNSYNDLQHGIATFNKLPEGEQKQIYAIALLVGIGGLLTITDSRRRYR